MAKTRGTGLLMVWADIDPEFEAEYHRWYDEEHIASARRARVSKRRPLSGAEGQSQIPRAL